MSRSGSGLFSLFFSGGDPDDRRINDVAAPKIYLEITIEEKEASQKKKKIPITLYNMPGFKKQKTVKPESRKDKEPEPSSPEDSGSEAEETPGNPQAQDEAAEAEDKKPLPKSFKELGVIPQLCEACDNLGFKAPTAIQAEAIPLALQGRDLIGLAETGSGKTAAFALPILQSTDRFPRTIAEEKTC